MRGPIAVVVACALGVVAAGTACGGTRRPAEPMAGSAAILPSPVLAERVPTDVPGSPNTAGSAAAMPLSPPSSTTVPAQTSTPTTTATATATASAKTSPTSPGY